MMSFTFFQTMSLALNFCLCHDLIKTLKDPFYPGKRRMKFYLYGSIGVAILVSALSKNTLRKSCEKAQKQRDSLICPSASNDQIIEDGYYYTYVIGLLQLVAFVLVALYSCVFAYRRLTRPGTSPEVRYVFIRKHITYVSVFIILWTFSLAHSYFQIFYAAQDLCKLPEQDRDARVQEYVDIDQVMLKITIYTSIVTGFFMSIIRAREPYFRNLVAKEFLSWFGMLPKENNSEEYVNDSLATFLTSSLNVELVHVILKAITKHTDGMTECHVDYLYYKDKWAQVTRDHSFIIDTIKINNPDKWKVAKLGDFLEKTTADQKKQTMKRKATEQQTSQTQLLHSSEESKDMMNRI